MGGRPLRTTLVLVLCAAAGFLAACGSGKNHPKPAGTVPPPQPTTATTDSTG